MVTRTGVLAPASRKACRAGVARVVFRCSFLYISQLLYTHSMVGCSFLYISRLLFSHSMVIYLRLLYSRSGKCLLLLLGTLYRGG